MQLSDEDLRYLRVFTEEAYREGSDGWLPCEEAEVRSGVNEEVRGRRAVRLANIGLLRQRKLGYPDFCITPAGIEAIGTKAMGSGGKHPAPLSRKNRQCAVLYGTI